MKDLIKALEIFVKYGNPNNPTHCEHDTLYVLIEAKLVKKKDRKKLDKLGFFVNDNGTFSSYKFGSA